MCYTRDYEHIIYDFLLCFEWLRWWLCTSFSAGCEEQQMARGGEPIENPVLWIKDTVSHKFKLNESVKRLKTKRKSALYKESAHTAQ